MTGKFSRFAIVVWVLASAAIPLSALDEPTALTGTVRDGRGTPQQGATVELLRSDTSIAATVFTDEYGRFLLSHLVPGTYSLKATGTLFLPTLRENLQVLAHRRLAVNLTLSTVVEAFQWLPVSRRPADEPDDEWAWTLRSAANRPLLRLLEDGPLVVVSDTNTAPVLKARVTVNSGANQLGQGGLHHAFEVERSVQDDRRLILRADLGSTEGAAVGSVKTLVGYEQQVSPANTIRTVAAFEELPEIAQTGSQRGIRAVTLRTSETAQLAPFLDAEVGSDFQAIQGNRSVFLNHPFGTVTWRDGDLSIAYHVATMLNAQHASEIDQDASALPALTEDGGVLQTERGLHQEVQLERSGERYRFQVAYYRDKVVHPVVNGGGNLSLADLNGGYVVYDPITQLLNVAGGDYMTNGVVSAIKSRLYGQTWMALSFADGDALTMQGIEPRASLSSTLKTLKPQHVQMYSASLSGRIERTNTHWRTSYRWQPKDTVTAVASFDTTTPDAYLNVMLRQPLHCWHLLPSGMEALVDVRNLLAEGYRPFVTSDGSTLYFAQADRSVQGGVSFTF